MKKIYIFLAVLLLILPGCSIFKPDKSPMIRVEDVNCSAMGYVPAEEVDRVIDLTNKLIDVTNVCLAGSNFSSLPHIKKYSIDS
jgi:hypothetical protein